MQSLFARYKINFAPAHPEVKVEGLAEATREVQRSESPQ